MTDASFLELHDRHCRGDRVAGSARRLGLPKDNENSDSCNVLVIIMMIDEDKTQILIVMMLCKGGRSAAGAGRPTQPNRCQCVIDLGLLLFRINPFKPLKIMFYCCPSFKIFDIRSSWRPVEVSSYFSKYVLLHQPFICTLWSLSSNV